MSRPEVERGVGLTLSRYSYRDATDTYEPSGSASYLGGGRWSGKQHMVAHRRESFGLSLQDAVLSFHGWSNGYMRSEVTGPIPAGAAVLRRDEPIGELW